MLIRAILARSTCRRHAETTLRHPVDEQHNAAFMNDIWRKYLGAANEELIDYARHCVHGIGPGS